MHRPAVRGLMADIEVINKAIELIGSGIDNAR